MTVPFEALRRGWRRPLPGSVAEKLIALRWHAVAALAFFTLAVPNWLGLILPRAELLAIAALLCAFNLACHVPPLRLNSPRGLFVQLVVDQCGWGAVLYLAGGATNPLITLLLPPVAIAAAVLPARQAWWLALLAIAEYTLLWQWHVPLEWQAAAHAAHHGSHADHQDQIISWHLAGMWLTFAVTTLLITGYVTRLTGQVRERDEALARIREDALRDQQVLALGNLAAGAAHRLGSPLATLAVLTQELAQDGRLPDDVREDCALMRAEVTRCKDILAALSAQAHTLQAPPWQSVAIWLQEVIESWRNHAPLARLHMAPLTTLTTVGFCPDPTLVQAIHNLLDNAWRASPAEDGIELSTGCTDQRWWLEIADRGPGLADGLDSRLGREVLNSAGMGIGVLLAASSIERAGGSWWFAAREGGGTRVHVELPLIPAATPSAGTPPVVAAG